MSPWTVVAVNSDGRDKLVVRLDLAASLFPDAKKILPFDCDPDGMPPWTESGAVKLHGSTLLEKLGTSHPAIKDALADLLRAPAAQKRPLYFNIQADDGERLWWEALCDGNGRFLGLDPRWPIARIADVGVRLRSPVYSFKPPLKVMALLSALGRDAAPEWESFYEAVETARGQGLALQVKVVVGQPDLFQDLSARVLPDITVHPVPDRLADLTALIQGFSPQIVHFFCHGSASLGASRLELATFADVARQDGRSSMVLSVDDLIGISSNLEIWLVTLNCCEGGKAADRLHSMAYRLVAEGEIPNAVGMLEPVDAADAHEFCRYFYPGVYAALQQAFQAAGPAGSAEVQFTDALFPPRTALRDAHPDAADNRQWVRPVLYVRPEAFAIRTTQSAELPAGVMADMKQRAKTVADALRSLPPDTPLDVRQRILALLDNPPVVPGEMRPDTAGNFSSGA